MPLFILFLALIFASNPSFGERTCEKSQLNNLKSVVENCETTISGFKCKPDCHQPEKKNNHCPDVACRGQRCIGQIPSYPKPVNIFIPHNFDYSKPANLALHFHGHNAGANPSAVHIDPNDGRGDYACFAAQSKTNTIVVIPESENKCDDYRKITPSGFVQMLKEIRSATAESKMIWNDQSRLTLSGHSGAYTILNQIGKWIDSNKEVKAALQPLSGVGLFDTLYGDKPGIQNLINFMEKKGMPYSTYLTWDPDTGTAPASQAMAAVNKSNSSMTSIGARVGHNYHMMNYMTSFLSKTEPK